MLDSNRMDGDVEVYESKGICSDVESVYLLNAVTKSHKRDSSNVGTDEVAIHRSRGSVHGMLNTLWASLRANDVWCRHVYTCDRHKGLESGNPSSENDCVESAPSYRER